MYPPKVSDYNKVSRLAFSQLENSVDKKLFSDKNFCTLQDYNNGCAQKYFQQGNSQLLPFIATILSVEFARQIRSVNIS